MQPFLVSTAELRNDRKYIRSKVKVGSLKISPSVKVSQHIKLSKKFTTHRLQSSHKAGRLCVVEDGVLLHLCKAMKKRADLSHINQIYQPQTSPFPCFDFLLL